LEHLLVQLVGRVAAATAAISATIIAFDVVHAAILTLALAFPSMKDGAVRRVGLRVLSRSSRSAPPGQDAAAIARPLDGRCRVGRRSAALAHVWRGRGSLALAPRTFAGDSGVGSGYVQKTAQKLVRTKPASTLIFTLSPRSAQSTRITRIRAL
jgi:hypothetical protein